MSTKTFKSFVSAGRFIEVKKNGDGTNLTIYKGPSRSNSYLGISVTPTDVPALALAILEAAGYAPNDHGGVVYAESTAVDKAAWYLSKNIEKRAEATKEAADREAQTKRRDDLAIQFGSSPLGYNDTFESTQRAIDRIIELEDKAKS